MKMTFESKKFNFNQLRKYSNFSENDNDKKLALKKNLGTLLKCDMNLIEKISPKKNKFLKILDDIEEEEINKKFYDNFLNNLYHNNEKRFKTKKNKKNQNENTYFSSPKNSAKLLSSKIFNLVGSVINKKHSRYESNNNINDYKKNNINYNLNNFNIKHIKINSNDDDNIKKIEKENKKYFKRNSYFMPNFFEKELEIEKNLRKAHDNKKEEENKYKNKEDKNINENDKYFSSNNSKKNNSYILKQTEKHKKLKFLNKEITYFKNDEKKEPKNNVNTLSDKNYDYVEEKKNIIIKSDNGYVINDKIDKKKKFCFCCIPII